MDYKKLFDLTGKVAVVTGGTGYLGSENVKILKDFGATVVNADIAAAESRWANAPENAGDMFVACDVSSTESIAACFRTVAEKYGKIDILVNCAAYGAGYGKGSQLEYMEDAVFNKGLDGTIGATFRGIREVVPYMKEHGGSIVNYCSMYGLVSPDLRIYGDNPQKQPPNYGALAEYGIRVNAVTPGPFPNPKNQDDEEFNAKLAYKTMLGRFGQNYEMAGAVLLLASDAGSFMTGTNIVVDGGWTAW